jgi:hypothetical protein
LYEYAPDRGQSTRIAGEQQAQLKRHREHPLPRDHGAVGGLRIEEREAAIVDDVFAKLESAASNSWTNSHSGAG